MNNEHQDRFGEGLSDSTGAFSDMSASEFGDEQVTWIEWFCHLKGNEFFVEVDDDYVQDDFNLTYLGKEILEFYDCDIYREALNMILDYDDHDESQSDAHAPLIEQASQCLYGLVHARFILTTRGMAAMFEKYNSYIYGSCPLLDCHAQNQAVLPMGMSDALGRGGTKVYCPRCKELYNPKSSKLDSIDGSYFGTSFPHLFFLTYPHLKPSSEPRSYISRIFGFRVSNQMKVALRTHKAENGTREDRKTPDSTTGGNLGAQGSRNTGADGSQRTAALVDKKDLSDSEKEEEEKPDEKDEKDNFFG